MKIYSADNISRSEVAEQVSAIDAKQAEQIKKLRIVLGVSFVINLAVAVGAYFF